MRSQAPSEWEACGGLNIHAHSLSCKDLCSKGLYTNWLTICILFTALTKLVPLSKRHCRTGPCIGRKRLNALMIQKVFNSSTSSIGYTLIPSKQNCAYRACGQSTWRAPCRHTQRSKGFNANKCKRDLVSKRYLRILLAEGSSQFLKTWHNDESRRLSDAWLVLWFTNKILGIHPWNPYILKMMDRETQSDH